LSLAIGVGTLVLILAMPGSATASKVCTGFHGSQSPGCSYEGYHHRRACRYYYPQSYRDYYTSDYYYVPPYRFHRRHKTYRYGRSYYRPSYKRYHGRHRRR
jgi:hypothetical protein